MMSKSQQQMLIAFLSVLLFVGAAYTAIPTPKLVQPDKYWTLDVRFEHPKLLVYKPTPLSSPKRFWYTIMTVTNNTGSDADFITDCEMLTDTLQLTAAGKSVPPAVFKLIKHRHRRHYPLLENIEFTSQKLLEGADNARDIVIIWPDFDKKASKVKLFVTGLSNETVAVNHPVAKDKAGKPKKIYLRKTLELVYDVSGDATVLSGRRLSYKSRSWIFR